MFKWLRSVVFGDLSCEEVRSSGSDYLDGDLSPSMGRRVQRHLARCVRCASFMSTLKASISGMRSLPRRTAPGSLRRRILEETRREEQGG